MRWPVGMVAVGWFVLFGAHLRPETGGPAEADAYGFVLGDPEWALLCIVAAIITLSLAHARFRDEDWWMRLCLAYLLTIAILRLAVFAHDGNWSALGTWVIVGGLALLVRAYRTAFHRAQIELTAARRDASD